MPIIAALAIDVVLTIAFAALGRASHNEGLDPLGVLRTAWPFLAGLLLGWLIARAVRRTWPLRWQDAWPVWLVTVTVGMLLRWAVGQGTATAFIIVATITLGVLLLGWRALASRWRGQPASQ